MEQTIGLIFKISNLLLKTFPASWAFKGTAESAQWDIHRKFPWWHELGAKSNGATGNGKDSYCEKRNDWGVRREEKRGMKTRYWDNASKTACEKESKEKKNMRQDGKEREKEDKEDGFANKRAESRAVNKLHLKYEFFKSILFHTFPLRLIG